MRSTLALLTLVLLAGCGGSQTATPHVNESTRVAGDLERQSRQIAGEAANGAAAIERAMENQTAVVFDQRDNPFNEAAPEVDVSAEPEGAPDANALR